MFATPPVTFLATLPTALVAVFVAYPLDLRRLLGKDHRRLTNPALRVDLRFTISIFTQYFLLYRPINLKDPYTQIGISKKDLEQIL